MTNTTTQPRHHPRVTTDQWGDYLARYRAETDQVSAGVLAGWIARNASAQMHEQWARQADLSTLKGGMNWLNRSYTTDTLAFYNARSFADFAAKQGA